MWVGFVDTRLVTFNTTEYFLGDFWARHHNSVRGTPRCYCHREHKIRRCGPARPLFVCLASILSGRVSRGNLVYFLLLPEDGTLREARLIAYWLLMFLARVKRCQLYAALPVTVM